MSKLSGNNTCPTEIKGMATIVLFLEVSCKPSSDLLAGQEEIIRF